MFRFRRGSLYRRNRKGEAGFTLVEVMITLLVMTLALLGILYANTQVQQTSEAAFERSLAVQDANRVIEQMRNISSDGDFPDNVTDIYPDGGEVAALAGLNLTNEVVTVSYVDPDLDPLDVLVTVSWDENGRRNVDIALRTIMTQRTTS